MEVTHGLGPIDIAVSGLKAQSKQIEVISSNVANSRTVDSGKGEPYRRRVVSFKTDDEWGGRSGSDSCRYEQFYEDDGSGESFGGCRRVCLDAQR